MMTNLNKGKKVYRQITVAFLLLAISIETLLFGYWYFMLQPRLQKEAEVSANLIAQAQAESVSYALLSGHGKFNYDDTIVALDKILMSIDTTIQQPFVQRITLELDQSVFSNEIKQPVIIRGDFDCLKCFKSAVPLYSEASFELMGVATFQISDAYFKALDNDVKIKLIIESIVSQIFLLITWRLVINLSARLEKQTQNRIRAEVALQEKNLQIERLLNQLSQYFVYKRDEQGRFLSVSDSIETILGYSTSQFRENYVNYVSQHKDNQCFLDQACQVVETEGNEYSCNVQMIDSKGHLHWIELSEVEKFDKENYCVVREGIGRDITENRNNQAKLEEAKKLAEHASQTKGDFLANMSHEIRTPMNAIMGMSYLALKTSLTDQQHDYLTKIQNSTRGLLGIINDILDFSKIEAGKLGMEEVDFMLDNVLENLCSNCSDKANEKNLILNINKSNSIPNVLIGDPLRLGQILINLVTNAIKFTQQGEVSVDINLMQKRDKRVELEFKIQDTGIGISQDKIQHLFDPFSQADSSITRKFGGTGLGLSISQHLVEMMNGTIQVESIEGQGSLFSFNVWLGFSHSAAAVSNSYFNHPLKGIKVLIVDDNEDSRMVLQDMLNEMSVNCDTEDNGQAALDQLEKADSEGNAYDLVLLDWKMPDLDGIEVIKLIHSHYKLTSVPTIVMVTAYERTELLRQIGNIKLDGVITKPINSSVLVDSMMNAFDKHSRKMGFKVSGYEGQFKQKLSASGKNILLVEDNSINQQVAKELLEGFDLSVVIASNGLEALQCLKKQVFDLVLMDLQMPEMDGFQATEKIRSQPVYDRIPIIAMTAHAMTGDKEKCLAMGMNDHLAKPVEPNRLVAMLNQWLGHDLAYEDRKLPEPQSDNTIDTKSAALPGFDRETGMKKVRNNQRMYEKLLTEFYQDHKETAYQIQQALQNNDRDTAIKKTHLIKGVSGNLGARELYALASELEQTLEDGVEYKISLQAFSQHFETVMMGLAEMIFIDQDNVTINSVQSKNMDLQQVMAQVDLLMSDLEKNRFNATQTLDQLAQLIDGYFKEEFNHLKTEVDAFAFKEAIICLNKLKEKLAQVKSDG